MMEFAHLVKPEIAAMLNAGDYAGFRKLSADLHPADVAEIVGDLDPDKRLLAFLALERSAQPEVFEYIEPEVQGELLAAFKPDTLRHVVTELSPDDRVMLLDELPGPLARKLLETLEAEERKATLELLAYPEDSAGRLMTPDFIHLYGSRTAAQALDKVRRLADEVETVYVLYVIDDKNRLVGTVSLRDLVVAEPSAEVASFMTENVISCRTTDDREVALQRMREYDLIALPVVDAGQRLVGIVTFDDIADVHSEEATEDILRMHGVAAEQDAYFGASLLSKYRQRVVWLVALAVVGAGSVLVQQAYNPVIAQLSLLAAYITMLTASGGNTGTQSAGILIRAISSGEYDRREVRRILLRELAVGVALALTMSVIATGLVLVRGAEPDVLGGHSVFEVAVVVSVAMFLSVATTNTLGALAPLLMRALKLDPAVTAGPFITTAADLITVLLYFNIANFVVLGL